jgi:RNA polymerase sigma factor (sigma-70 family)
MPEHMSAFIILLSKPVYTLIRRLVIRPAVAEDLLQDVFVELLRSVHTYSGAGSFVGWVKSIAVSKALMYLRSPWHRSDELQTRIQLLDLQLSTVATSDSDQDRAQRLWSTRVQLLSSLVSVRYAEAVRDGEASVNPLASAVI